MLPNICVVRLNMNQVVVTGVILSDGAMVEVARLFDSSTERF